MMKLTRKELLPCLKKLLPAQFKELIFCLEEALKQSVEEYLNSNVSQVEHCIELISFCERIPDGLSKLQSTLISIDLAGTGLKLIAHLLDSASIEKTEFATLCRQALPEGIELTNNEFCYLLKILHEKVQLSDGSVPLLDVLEVIQNNFPESNRTEFQDILRDIEDQFPQRQPNRRLTSIQTTANAPTPYLLIELWETDKAKETYHAQAWLYRSEQQVVNLCVYDSDASHIQQITFNQLPELLKMLRSQVAQHDIDMNQLHIEFFLPNDKLDIPIEHQYLKPDYDERSKTVGATYPVMVRSRDRLHEPELRYHWESRELSAEDHKKNSADCTHNFTCQKRIDFTRPLGQGKLCCVLKFRPKLEVLQRMLEDGVSVAIWLRVTRQKQEKLEEEFQQLFDCCLSSLPKKVWSARLEAWLSPQKNHFGNDITLFWDMPDRLPYALTPNTLQPPQ